MNISTLGQRTHFKLGELSYSFIVYNITIFDFIRSGMHGFLFYFLSFDNAHTLFSEISLETESKLQAKVQ